MKQMTLEEISKAAASGAFRKIPVSREIYSDIRTPVETLKVLQGVSSHCYMLESVEDKKQWGRYTFLGYDPSLELTCVNGNLTITADAAEMKKVEDIPESYKEQLPTGQIRLTAKTAHPGAVIKTLIEKNKSPKIATLPTFTGGLVGSFLSSSLAGLLGRSSLAGGSLRRSSRGSGAAAGGQAEHHSGAHQKSSQFFHGIFPRILFNKFPSPHLVCIQYSCINM